MYLARRPCPSATGPRAPVLQGEAASPALWAAISASLLCNNCQTSAQLQKIMVQTMLDTKVDNPASGGKWLWSSMVGCSQLAKWTPYCFNQAAAFMLQLKSDLVSQRLVLASTVSAATSASAGGRENRQLNRHCFVVSKYMTGCASVGPPATATAARTQTLHVCGCSARGRPP